MPPVSSSSIYAPLRDRLMSLKQSAVRLSFCDIEEILARPLPPSARKFAAWWGNNDQGGKRHSAAWRQAGWRTADLALEMEEVTFVRDSAPAPVPVFSAGISVSIGANWTSVGAVELGQDGKLSFPEVPPEAGVYRFRLYGGFGSRSYIGESIDLRRRFVSYRTPGSTQATNLRLNAAMIEHLRQGGEIGLDIITALGGMSDGASNRERSLTDKAVRLLLEQAAIVADGATEILSLNR